MNDTENELMRAVREGLSKAVQDKLGSSYNSPLEKLLQEIVAEHGGEIRTLLVEAIAGSLKDAAFRESIASAVRQKLARTLIDKFGGEFEKQVNQLKSDPATRARITLAIEEIVKQKPA